MTDRPSLRVRRRAFAPCLLRSAPVLLTALTVGSCAGLASPSPVWPPGVYDYSAELIGVGRLAGVIEVAVEGPVGVTPSVGECLPQRETNMRLEREGAELFRCNDAYLLMLFLEDDDGRRLAGFVSRSIGDDNLSADLRLVRR
jgi:hypothetical protein